MEGTTHLKRWKEPAGGTGGRKWNLKELCTTRMQIAIVVESEFERNLNQLQIPKPES